MKTIEAIKQAMKSTDWGAVGFIGAIVGVGIGWCLMMGSLFALYASLRGWL